MRLIKDNEPILVAGSSSNLANSTTITVDRTEGYAIYADVTDSTPSAKTFVSGVAQVDTVLFQSKAASGNGDFVVISAQNGDTYAASIDKSIPQVDTLLFPTKAGATNADYVQITAQDGTTFAAALDKISTAQIDTLNFPIKASLTSRDYILITAHDATTYAVFADKTGSDVAPTGAAYVAASFKSSFDVTTDTTAAQVATRAKTALNALTGFTAKITADDSAADGHLALTQVVKGVTAVPVPHNLGDTGAGTIATAATTPGVDQVTPSGAIYTAVNSARKVVVDITGNTTAAQNATSVNTALNLLTGFTAKITSSVAAADGHLALTQVTDGVVANPVPKSSNDGGAGTISTAATTAGINNVTPTASQWLAVSSGNRTRVDITAGSTAAQTATAVLTALNLITGFTTDITGSDAAADGHVSLTQAIRGVTSVPVPKNAAGSGAGGITTVATTAGVNSKVDTSAETITISSHGFLTGLKIRLTTTGTLPAGVTTGTDYFVIYVDTNTIKLASSLTNAQAGTAIDLTDQGSSGATNTATATTGMVGTVYLQASLDGTNFVTISGSSQNVTSTSTNFFWNVNDVMYKYVRFQGAPTTGQITFNAYITIKVENDNE